MQIRTGTFKLPNRSLEKTHSATASGHLSKNHLALFLREKSNGQQCLKIEVTGGA